MTNLTIHKILKIRMKKIIEYLTKTWHKNNLMLDLVVVLEYIMELTNEEIVTKLLSANQVLRVKNNMSFVTTPLYDLGDFLKNYKPEPSPYEGKYVFIR